MLHLLLGLLSISLVYSQDSPICRECNKNLTDCGTVPLGDKCKCYTDSMACLKTSGCIVFDIVKTSCDIGKAICPTLDCNVTTLLECGQCYVNRKCDNRCNCRVNTVKCLTEKNCPLATTSCVATRSFCPELECSVSGCAKCVVTYQDCLSSDPSKICGCATELGACLRTEECPGTIRSSQLDFTCPLLQTVCPDVGCATDNDECTNCAHTYRTCSATALVSNTPIKSLCECTGNYQKCLNDNQCGLTGMSLLCASQNSFCPSLSCPNRVAARLAKHITGLIKQYADNIADYIEKSEIKGRVIFGDITRVSNSERVQIEITLPNGETIDVYVPKLRKILATYFEIEAERVRINIDTSKKRQNSISGTISFDDDSSAGTIFLSVFSVLVALCLLFF